MKVRIPQSGGTADMLKQVQKMQADMQAKQAELEEAEYTVSAGGGAVTVKINGKKEILSLDIEPEIVDPDDVETLSDILVAGINQAIRTVEEAAASGMEEITGQMSLPGIPGMPGIPGLFGDAGIR